MMDHQYIPHFGGTVISWKRHRRPSFKKDTLWGESIGDHNMLDESDETIHIRPGSRASAVPLISSPSRRLVGYSLLSRPPEMGNRLPG